MTQTTPLFDVFALRDSRLESIVLHQEAPRWGENCIREAVMALLKDIDPTGLDEFSVVFTDRSLNHMSKAFQAGDAPTSRRC